MRIAVVVCLMLCGSACGGSARGRGRSDPLGTYVQAGVQLRAPRVRVKSDSRNILVTSGGGRAEAGAEARAGAEAKAGATADGKSQGSSTVEVEAAGAGSPARVRTGSGGAVRLEGAIGIEAPRARTTPPDARLEVGVDATAKAERTAQVEVPQVEVDAAVEDPQVAVPMEGSGTVEFFGIPLEHAQDVIFVLDRSGSMAKRAYVGVATSSEAASSGTSPSKMQVAHDELVDALQLLQEGTRINVLYFNESLEGYAPHFVTLTEAEREHIATFVTDTFADASTALAPAMRTAFMMNARRIVLLSDGLGNIGGDADDILRDAREAMKGGVRIDTIGLGAGQDVFLMRSLATESGGIYQQLR